VREQHHPLLCATPGTQREIVSFHYGEGGGRRVYIQAGLHGDEIPGIATAWYLKQHLLELERAGRLRAAFTLVPIANPIGLGQHWHGTHLGRFHAPSGQDFNRQFPQVGEALVQTLRGRLTQDEAENRRLIREALDHYYQQIRPATELASLRHTLMRMATQADLMLDIHCDWEALPHLYTMPHAWPEIEPLARWLGSEVQLLAEISGGEPFDEACCEPWLTLRSHFAAEYPMPRGLLPATLELRGVRDVSAGQAQQDAGAIIAALTAGGYISGEVKAAPPLRHAPTPLAGCEYLHAPHAGVVLHHRHPGDLVKPGEVVAEIVDPLEDKVTPLVAEHGGVLYARHWDRFACAGALVVRLAGAVPVRAGNLLVE